jgi:hypothetical protein
MNTYHFDADISGMGRGIVIDGAAGADAEAWRSAPRVLRERAYRTNEGLVRVRAAWPELVDVPSLRVPLEVVDESGHLAPHDLPAYVELFFHDVYLIFNLAAPGSFGGAIAISGGEYRTSEIVLDPRVFAYAWATAARNGRPSIAALPLADVARWYDTLRLGTQQLATSGVAKALFHLLHLARSAESEPMSILRLAHAVEVLSDAPNDLQRLFDLRDAFARGTAAIIHPMHDDALDARVAEASLAWIDAADHAASIVVSALQGEVRAG